MKRTVGIFFTLLLTLVFVPAITGCSSYLDYDPSSETSGGLQPPPPWEQDRGIGEEQHYYYYPQVKIYFNLERKVYYYFYEGQWQIASQLPNNVKLSGRRVKLNIPGEEPYIWQPAVEERFPPEAE